MKFFHLSDLHIGKYLNGYSLKENQESILSQIVCLARRERPDAIAICGDIYDKSAPSGEAYGIFDRFLQELSEIRPQIPVLIIAGNHDSPERLAYASSFLEKHRIHISVFPPQSREEYLKKITLEDEYGPVVFYLLPFLKPGYVRPLFGEGAIDGYESAVREVLNRERIDPSIRNVILSHQFYAGSKDGPETCESETAVIVAGGLDRVDASVLYGFDYAALGHLHGAQSCGRKSVRYCGSPCKYSVSEERHRKAVTVVTLGEKGEEPKVEFLPLYAPRDVRRVRGTLEEVLSAAGADEHGSAASPVGLLPPDAAPPLVQSSDVPSLYDGISPSAAALTPSPDDQTAGQSNGSDSGRFVCHDYVSVTITQEDEPYRIRELLEERYDHLLELRFDNERTRRRLREEGGEMSLLQPLEAFRQFFEAVRREPLSEAQERIMERLIQETKEEES